MGEPNLHRRRARRERLLLDDVGHPRELGRFDPSAVPDVFGPATAAVRSELHAALSRHATGFRQLFLLMGGLVAVTFGAMFGSMALVAALGGADRSVQPPNIAWWGFIVFFVVTFGALFAWAFFIDHAMRRRLSHRTKAFADCLLRYRRCPCCGRSLEATSADGDGRVACECGAVWRAGRLGSEQVGEGPAHAYEMACLLQQVLRGGMHNRITDHRGVRRARVRVVALQWPRCRAERIRISLPRFAGALIIGPVLIPFISVLHSPMVGQRLQPGAEVLPYAIPMVLASLAASIWLARHGRWRRIRLRICPTCHGRLKRTESNARSDEFTCATCGSVWDAARR